MYLIENVFDKLGLGYWDNRGPGNLGLERGKKVRVYPTHPSLGLKKNTTFGFRVRLAGKS